MWFTVVLYWIDRLYLRLGEKATVLLPYTTLPLPREVFPIRDNDSLKYIPHPCGTIFDALPSRVFSIRDNDSLKYIPYPCGTILDFLPRGAFSIRSKIQSEVHSISLWTGILHSP